MDSAAAATRGEQRQSLSRAVFKLYELADTVDEFYEASGGVVDWQSDTFQKWLDDASSNTLEALCQFVADRSARIVSAKNEIDRIHECITADENAIEWAEARTLDVLRKLDVRKAEAGLWRVSIRKGSPSVKQREGVEIDLGLLDPSLVRDVPAKQEADKKAIREALQRGEEVHGFHIVFGEEYVVIK